jgi:hypothetical protein
MEQSRSLRSFLLILIYAIFAKNLYSAKTDNLNLLPDWKPDAAKEFNTNTMVLQKIITDAESPDQITDFLDKFEKQKVWFDKTLQSSKATPSDSVKDEFYKKIATKNSRLDFLVTSIKKSDTILEKLELTSEQKKLIRLRLLYEINAKQSQMLSDENIRSLTIDIIEKVTGKKFTDFPELKLAQIQFTGKLEEIGREMLDLQITNRELLNKIDANQKTAADMMALISSLKNQVDEYSNKNDLTEQLCDSTVAEQAKLFKNELINTKKKSIWRYLKQRTLIIH